MDELTREFLIESQEGLDRMEGCLTELETRPADTALLADVFRSVHTIKGTTGFLGFTRLEKLAHAGENLLALLRDGKLTADGDVITCLLQLLDGLRSILKQIECDGGEGDATDEELIERLNQLQAPAELRFPTQVHAARTTIDVAAAPASSRKAEKAPPETESRSAEKSPAPSLDKALHRLRKARCAWTSPC
jgi:two-component system chemotaxis sensor kinase CheA